MLDFRKLVRYTHFYVEIAPDPSEISLEGFAYWVTSKLDYKKLRKSDIYQMCLDRLPEVQVIERDYYESPSDMASHIVRCLTCEEIRAKLPELVCKYFPNARRTFFVHIPKTGGTGVRDRLINHTTLPIWDFSYEGTFVFNALGNPFVVLYLSKIYENRNREFVFTGHRPLSDILNRGLLRCYDRSFTVIRNPLEIVVSNVNYIIDALVNHPGQPDSMAWSAWIERLGLGIPSELEEGMLMKLFEGLITSQEFKTNYANPYMKYLGNGDSSYLQAVLSNLLISNTQVVEIRVIDEYLKMNFAIDTENYDRNKPPRLLENFEKLSRATKIYVVENLCDKDINLYFYLSRIMTAQNVNIIIPQEHCV